MKKSEVNKSLAAIWARIKKIYNETPWHAAISYPFVFLFFISILSILLDYLSIGLWDSIRWVVVFVIPIWILLGLIVSKRRAPYIITISIFFGFPFIVGIVSSGFEKSAKANATKVIHAEAIEYISDEIKKCIRGENIFAGDQRCPATPVKVINGAITNIKYKNPFFNEKNSVRKSDSNINDEDVGYVNLSTLGSNVIIKTCIKKSCNNKKNSLQDSIKVK